MKKTIIYGAIILLGASSLTSCKKTWTCNCTQTMLGTSTKYSISIPDQKKSDAETICDNADNNYSSTSLQQSGYSNSCELQ